MCFYNLKKKYQFYIIEDACHSLGSSYKYKNNYLKIGSCAHSDICVFSFHPVKTITTGEGGLLCTNSKKIYTTAKQFRSHNILRNKNYWDYDIKKTSFNYRTANFLNPLLCPVLLSSVPVDAMKTVSAVSSRNCPPIIFFVFLFFFALINY